MEHVTERPNWTQLKKAKRVWAEDDATISQLDHETVDRAFKRIYGVTMPNHLEIYDDGESVYKRLPMGIVICESYPGNSEIAVWLHPEQWSSTG